MEMEMNRVQVSGPSRIITGTIITNENLVMEWLTALFLSDCG